MELQTTTKENIMYGINRKGEFLAANVKDTKKMAAVIFNDMFDDEDRACSTFSEVHSYCSADYYLPSPGKLSDDAFCAVVNDIIEHLNVLLAA